MGNPGGIGSGDVGQNLLPVSMKIAAQTIGLDLVAVKPTASPKVDLLFVDFKYDNNSTEKDQKPLVFKIDSNNIKTLVDALKAEMVKPANNVIERVGGLSKRMWYNISTGIITIVDPITTPSYQYWLEFLGFSKVDGQPMFRTYRQVLTPQLGEL